MLHSKAELSFYEFIAKRRELYKERLSLAPPPWTDDEILSRYRFCNVERELDAGTQHIIRYVCAKKGLSMYEKIMNIVLYRRFNVRNFFTEIFHGAIRSKEWEEKFLLRHLDLAKRKGVKLYNNAYVINPAVSNIKKRPKDKHAQIVYSTLKFCEPAREIVKGLQAEAICCLIKDSIIGVGPFLSYQMVLDMGYAKEFNILGLDSWCDVGPGAKVGLMSIYPKEKPTLDLVISLQRRQPYKEILRLSDIENCLCEWGKYMKIKTGTKCRRRYYEPKIKSI